MLDKEILISYLRDFQDQSNVSEHKSRILEGMDLGRLSFSYELLSLIESDFFDIDKYTNIREVLLPLDIETVKCEVSYGGRLPVGPERV